jgi:hypothetical protein
MRGILFSGNGLGRTGFYACLTPSAQVSVDKKLNQISTDTGRTSFFDDVRHIFVAKIMERCEHRVGSAFAKTAQRCVFNA